MGEKVHFLSDQIQMHISMSAQRTHQDVRGDVGKGLPRECMQVHAVAVHDIESGVLLAGQQRVCVGSTEAAEGG